MNFRWNTVQSSFSSREETTYFLTCTDWLHCGNVNRLLLPRAHVVGLPSVMKRCMCWNHFNKEHCTRPIRLWAELKKEFCQGYQNIFPMVLWDRDNLLLIILNATLGDSTYPDGGESKTPRGLLGQLGQQLTWLLQGYNSTDVTTYCQAEFVSATVWLLGNIIRWIFITQWFFGREKKTFFMEIIILIMIYNYMTYRYILHTPQHS